MLKYQDLPVCKPISMNQKTEYSIQITNFHELLRLGNALYCKYAANHRKKDA